MQFNHLTQNVADQRLVNLIAKSYNTLDYLPTLVGFLESLYPTENFANLQKYQLHQAINAVLCRQYQGEQTIKHSLFLEFAKKKVVAAFEINVGRSRVDFLTINGYSSSFEIKSGLDNLTKLAKQTSDYRQAFDFNYLVVDQKHVKIVETLIPENFGIWAIIRGRKRIIRPAQLNASINSEFQLRLLTKRELSQHFQLYKGDIGKILAGQSSDEINKCFKAALKNRYQIRWEFLLTHQEAILPIDLQFFFNRNIAPDIIYH